MLVRKLRIVHWWELVCWHWEASWCLHNQETLYCNVGLRSWAVIGCNWWLLFMAVRVLSTLPACSCCQHAGRSLSSCCGCSPLRRWYVKDQASLFGHQLMFSSNNRNIGYMLVFSLKLTKWIFRFPSSMSSVDFVMTKQHSVRKLPVCDNTVASMRQMQRCWTWHSWIIKINSQSV